MCKVKTGSTRLQVCKATEAQMEKLWYIPQDDSSLPQVHYRPPNLWNSLPEEVRKTSVLLVLHKLRKAEIFSKIFL